VYFQRNIFVFHRGISWESFLGIPLDLQVERVEKEGDRKKMQD